MANFSFDMPGLMRHLRIAKSKISDKRVKEVLREEVINAYTVAAYETPQYSGYLVSNLRIQVNGIGDGVATDLEEAHNNWHELGKSYGGIKQKGDEYAIGIASTYNRWFNNFATDPAFSMSDRVEIKYINAPHWRTAEAGVKLRDVNAPGRALATAKEKIHWNRSGWLYGTSTGGMI